MSLSATVESQIGANDNLHDSLAHSNGFNTACMASVTLKLSRR